MVFHKIFPKMPFLAKNSFAFEKCLQPKDPQFLIDIKLGKFSYEKAVQMKDESMAKIEEMAKKFVNEQVEFQSIYNKYVGLVGIVNIDSIAMSSNYNAFERAYMNQAVAAFGNADFSNLTLSNSCVIPPFRYVQMLTGQQSTVRLYHIAFILSTFFHKSRKPLSKC